MEVSVQKKEVVAAICVTFNEADIEQMKKLIEKNQYSDQGLLLRSILSKACIETPKPKSTSFWYVTVQGNNHVLADAVGLIKSKIPDYVNGLTSPKNWLNEREVSVGMWEEKEARVVQRFLSGHGFETSLIKAGQ